MDAGPSPRQLLRADLPAVASARPDSLGPRYHGLDALRGTTMVLVVVLHAALAYAVLPIPNLIWAVAATPRAHPAFDLLCWWTLSISSLFYLMSGFFAAELCDARGLLAFLVNRAQRHRPSVFGRGPFRYFRRPTSSGPSGGSSRGSALRGNSCA